MPRSLYLDPTAGIEDRTSDLLGQMTLPEKVGQMLQLDARQDLGDIVTHRMAGSILHASPARMLEALELVRQTRLQIPLLTADDCIHGHSFWPGATIFPTQLAMAGTWDPELVQRAARAAAVEISATGIHWTFSPVLCIARDLRWGRVNETFGEDPHLIGALAEAMAAGYQGEGLDDPTGVLACAKHFAGYSETQGGRDASEADISRRKLRSWFLPPFERVARSGIRTFMLGYQSMDGVPITANQWLIREVLKGEWGFTGLLVTDWDNVGRMVWEQKLFDDLPHAAAAAINAGNDLIMTTPGFFEAAQNAVEAGLVREQQIDDAVRRILRVKFELGLFEDPRSPDSDRQQIVIGCDEHRQLNLDIARRGLVLLANDGTLPFGGGLTAGQDGRATSTGSHQTIAVLGPNADDPQSMLGDWAGASGQVNWMPDGQPRDLVQTVLDGIRGVAPTGWLITHEPGANIGTLIPDPAGETFPDGQPRPPVFSAATVDDQQLNRAADAAARADLAVVVVGDTVALTGENCSTATLDLQGGQRPLLDAIAATGTPMVVVLVQSKPSTLPPSAMGAAAIIEAFNPGMRGGQAIAELIFGLIEPSGRLPISFARHVGQQPTYYNQIRGQHGDRYADLDQTPLFAFGDGLSYTTVTYSNLIIDKPLLEATDTLRGSVTLTNTGSRPSTETVQIYVSDLVTSVTWADQELKGFEQVHLSPGDTVVVPIKLPIADLTVVDATGSRMIEAGDFELRVGPSSTAATQLTHGFTVTS